MSLYEAAKAVLQHSPVDNLDLRKAVMDLMSLALEADEEIGNLRRSVRELEQAGEIKQALILDQGVYWLPDQSGNRRGPYCPACWGKGKELVPMLLTETAQKGKFWAICSVHHQVSGFTVTIPGRV